MNFKPIKKTPKKKFRSKHRLINEFNPTYPEIEAEIPKTGKNVEIAPNVSFDTEPNNETLHTPMVSEYPQTGTEEQTNQSFDSLHSYVLRPNTQKKGANHSSGLHGSNEKIDLKRKQIFKTDQPKSKIQRLNKTDPFACLK